MGRHRLTKIWLGALALAFVLAAAGQLDALDDHSAEQAQADELLAAQRQAQALERRERAGRDLCAARGGENTVATWQDDSVLVCSTKRGRTVTRLRVAAL